MAYRSVDGLVVVTGPAVEPVTAVELARHLNIEGAELTDGLAELDDAILAGRRWVENEIARPMIRTRYDWSVDYFPGGLEFGRRFAFFGILEIPRAPVLGVISVKWRDSDDVLQTVPATDYVVDVTREPGRIYPANGKLWPTPLDRPDAVVIRFEAGYGDAAAAVPEDLRRAIKIQAAGFYEKRGESVENGVRRLLDHYRYEVYQG